MKTTKSYFTTQRDSNDRWQSTTLHLPVDTAPYYRVLTGGKNRRFMLASPVQTLYWGCVTSDYYGAHLLHNPTPLDASEMLIPRIHSREVETSKQHADTNEYWANYFAKALLTSEKHFLNQGEWRIIHCPSYQEAGWGEPNTRYSLAIPDGIYSPDDVLQYTDWNVNMIYYNNLNEHDGRVKWWRKKVREGVCPPIFTWFQSHLQAHFLIDGRARLLACQLENIAPTVLSISHTHEKSYDISPEKLTELQEIIDKYGDNMPTDTLNQLLIKRHSPTVTDEYATLYSTAVRDLDVRWLQEVKHLVSQYPVDDDELQCMIDGC